MSRGDSQGGGGTMSPAGQFGLKKNVAAPVDIQDEDEKVVETQEAETIPDVKAKVGEPTESKSTMKEPSEEAGIEDIEDSFVCPVCDREFSKKIGLTGHLRGPCGKKIKK